VLTAPRPDDFPYSRKFPGKEQLIMAENQSSLQELQGRSQHLTCDSVEIVLVDRQTLKELHWSLTKAVDEIDSIRLQQEFIVVAQLFLSQIPGRRAEKVSLFLEKWFEHSLSQLKNVEVELSEAQRVSQLILAISKMGGE
jgi:hypothetical protein